MNNVSNLATEVLKDLSSRVNNITVTAVVSAVLKYALLFATLSLSMSFPLPRFILFFFPSSLHPHFSAYTFLSHSHTFPLSSCFLP